MVHIVIISIDYESPCELVVSTDVFKRLVGLEYVYIGCRWISIGVVNRRKQRLASGLFIAVRRPKV